MRKTITVGALVLATTMTLSGARQEPAGRVGEGAWVNYDFTPGTRPLFVEDFSQDPVGDFPKRLTLQDGNMEVAEWQGRKLLRVTSWPGTFKIVLKQPLPARFTLEMDMTGGYSGNWTIFKFSPKSDQDVRFRVLGGKGVGGVFGPNHQTQGETRGPVDPKSLHRIRIMADGAYVKTYINDTRVGNTPNADIGRTNTISVEVPGHADEPVFIGNISLMEGGRKLFEDLSKAGRVATQGIYFDTGSERIRPESTPTLKEIAQMLTENPDLKLTIEGHTDNVGNADANLALSEKRAAAVKDALVTAFKIDAGRLSSRGLGATKPAAPNDTPEGRQSNRRVELVKG